MSHPGVSDYNQDTFIIPGSHWEIVMEKRCAMFEDSKGPIESFEWGRFTIHGENHSMEGEGVGKDICILNGEVRAWAARNGHTVKPHMLGLVLRADVDVLVIGNGVYGKLKITQAARKVIREDGIEQLIIEETPDACATYNRLVREGKRVAFLAHGTC